MKTISQLKTRTNYDKTILTYDFTGVHSRQHSVNVYAEAVVEVCCRRVALHRAILRRWQEFDLAVPRHRRSRRPGVASTDELPGLCFCEPMARTFIFVDFEVCEIITLTSDTVRDASDLGSS